VAIQERQHNVIVQSRQENGARVIQTQLFFSSPLQTAEHFSDWVVSGFALH